jgi:uncharacterized protein involved in exopolysaccharide biosynthesis
MEAKLVVLPHSARQAARWEEAASSNGEQHLASVPSSALSDVRQNPPGQDAAKSVSHPAKAPQFYSADGLQRQVSVAAGVAIAVTAGSLTNALNQAPLYEGNFEITAETVTAPDASRTPAVKSAIADVTQPTPISETAVRVLESPKLLDPIIKEYQRQDPNFDYATFVHNLDIRVQGQTLQVTYRDTDPDKVRWVLDELSQAYTTYGQRCQDSSCLGIQFIQEQIPKVQERVNARRAELQKFYAEQGLNSVDTQLKLFSARSVEIARQEATLEGSLNEARDQYQQLQQRMALKPDEAVALNILGQDARYRMMLEAFQTVDRKIAIAYSSLQPNTPALQALYEQQQILANQLYTEAPLVLERFITNPNANLQDPVLQEKPYAELLQQSMIMANHIQVLQIRQETLTDVKTTLAKQRNQLATVLRQYGDLQLKLQAEMGILQQYADRLETLQQQAPEVQQTWQLTNAPDLTSDILGQPLAQIPDFQRNLAIGALVGVLLGVALAAVLDKRRTIAQTIDENPDLSSGQSAGYSGTVSLPLDMAWSQSMFQDSQLGDRLNVA